MFQKNDMETQVVNSIFINSDATSPPSMLWENYSLTRGTELLNGNVPPSRMATHRSIVRSVSDVIMYENSHIEWIEHYQASKIGPSRNCL